MEGLARVLPQQLHRHRLCCYGEVDQPRHPGIDTDPAMGLPGIVDGEVVVVGSGADLVQVEGDPTDLLVRFAPNRNAQKLVAQLALGHRQLHAVFIRPLNYNTDQP